MDPGMTGTFSKRFATSSALHTSWRTLNGQDTAVHGTCVAFSLARLDALFVAYLCDGHLIGRQTLS